MVIGDLFYDPATKTTNRSKPMIELKNDTLCFSFPKVIEELENLAKEYFQQMLPRILTEDRDADLAGKTWT